MSASITKLLKPFLFFFCIIYFNHANSQVTQEWIHRYTGPESSTDVPAHFALDGSGNIYITGKSIMSGGYADIVTVKFNSAGIRQWIAKYNGPYNQNDEGNDIKIDSYGNVYITGITMAVLGSYNIVTIKYNSQGIQQWTRIYNGSGDFDDYGSSIAIDTIGNVYTGGYSYGTATGYDFILIKYNSSGDLQWTRIWNGTSNSDDYIKKISLMSDGEIAVAGTSYDNSSSFDLVTLKYNSSGSLQWTRKYNGPASGDDQLENMKTDFQNNIYVCGRSIGINTGHDYAVVKYNSSGTEQWTARYNGASSNDDVASSLDIDVSGNVFVTGYSYGITSYYDFVTIKYNPAGAQQWLRIFNGAENYFDRAYVIKADGAGNAYVTGHSIKFSDGTSDVTTIKYSSSGNTEWMKTYNGPGNLDDNPVQLETDKSDNVFVIANSYSYFFNPLCGTSDYLLLKYNSNSSLEWETRYDGAGSGIDKATALAIDNNGNCYATGLSFYSLSNLDFATVKYNSSGAPQWVLSYDGNSNGLDKAAAIVADNNGHIYVTGSSQGNGTGYDIATLKYNTLGSLVWERRYNGNSNGDDFASGISVDAAGNVYLTGYSDGSGTAKDYVTIKYNSAGTQQWASRYNGNGNLNDYATHIALDISGNIYVTGKSAGNGTMQDIATVKYNSSGGQVWASRFNGAANDSDEANSISIDASGNVIVAGKSKSANSNYDFITVKYNSSGAQQWAATYNGTANSDDELVSSVTDNAGNVYVTGSSKNIITDADYTAIKYNTAGSQLWISNFNGTSNSNDNASSMCIDLAGNLFITGFCKDIGTNMNYCTIKLNNNGEFRWCEKYNYIDNDSDKATAVKVDSEGNVYVTGFSKGIEGAQDFATIKYKQDKTIELKTLIEGFYDENTNNMVSDSMRVYLRSSSPPYNIIESSIAVLDNSGNGLFTFLNVANNVNYYIVLQHRNSIETWSAAGSSFLSGGMYYDFTDASSKAYGNNMKQKGNKFCIFSGDANKDGIIDASDMSIVDNDAFNFLSGYIISDVNGDDIADGSDLSIVDNNAFNFIGVIRP